MSRKNIIKNKSFEFALSIVNLVRKVQYKDNEYVLSRQLLKSGTAIGAIISEAEHAESKKDFIHKMSIALKEANESKYWLQLMHQSNYINIDVYNQFYNDLIEIIRILITIVKSAKKNLRRN